MNFTIMHQDEPVAEIYVSGDKTETKIRKLIPDGIKQPFSGNTYNILRLYRFLKDRCYEDCRYDLPDILEEANMESNNPWEWIKVSHGVTYEDFFWIRFPGEDLTWKDVRVR